MPEWPGKPTRYRQKHWIKAMREDWDRRARIEDSPDLARWIA